MITEAKHKEDDRSANIEPLDKSKRGRGCRRKTSNSKHPTKYHVSILYNNKNRNNGCCSVSSAKKKSSVARASSLMDAVVKVFCVQTEPNFLLPWQKKRQCSSISSGFVISGRRILTNAHSVEYHTQVKLKKRGSDTKYLATVLAVGTECDIALLTVSDDDFWEGLSPIEFGDQPALQDAVSVVGYPIGGDTISVTSGVVSRIEVLSYAHESTELLGLQIDAAINSGNSGGPAFNDKGGCVGIAFQCLKNEDAQNIGYVIPTQVVMHFIQDYEKNGAYTGFPVLGVEWQDMENPDLRLSMGMKPDQKGVRISRIDPTATEFMLLKPSDIILSFDGVGIANDGTVPFMNGERISFSYLASQKHTGDTASIEVLRNSENLKFEIRLSTQTRLIPAHNDKPPSYYIVAGFVFTTVTVPYLRQCDTVKLLDKLCHGIPQSLEEEVVILSQVLVSDINIGYEDIANTQVLAFNGQPVKNLKSLATMVENCQEEYLKFDLEYELLVVLQTKTAKAATMDILSTHCIPSVMSNDLQATMDILSTRCIPSVMPDDLQETKDVLSTHCIPSVMPDNLQETKDVLSTHCIPSVMPDDLQETKNVLSTHCIPSVMPDDLQETKDVLSTRVPSATSDDLQAWHRLVTSLHSTLSPGE